MRPEEIQKIISEALQDGVNLRIWPYIILGILAFLASYLGTYLRSKGENLATKEDIKDITDKVESVRHQYSSQLESIKAAMGSKLYIHQIRYEKEFIILSDLAEKLIELRDAAKGLRPDIDSWNPDEPEDERKQKRLSRYNKASLALYEITEKRRPFYPEEIYETLHKFDKITWTEAIQYKNRTYNEGKGYDSEYWEKAATNSSEISKLAEESIAAIRTRVKQWESLDFKKSNTIDNN